jgi:hypothetical protein
MKGALAIRKPVQTAYLNTGSTNITTSAWVTLLAAASNLVAASAVEIFNPSGSTLIIALGAAGSEVAIPYTIIPGGTVVVLAMEIPAKTRVSVKAVDTTVSSGYMVFNEYA